MNQPSPRLKCKSIRTLRRGIIVFDQYLFDDGSVWNRNCNHKNNWVCVWQPEPKLAASASKFLDDLRDAVAETNAEIDSLKAQLKDRTQELHATQEKLRQREWSLDRLRKAYSELKVRDVELTQLPLKAIRVLATAAKFFERTSKGETPLWNSENDRHRAQKAFDAIRAFNLGDYTSEPYDCKL